MDYSESEKFLRLYMETPDLIRDLAGGNPLKSILINKLVAAAIIVTAQKDIEILDALKTTLSFDEDDCYSGQAIADSMDKVIEVIKRRSHMIN